MSKKVLIVGGVAGGASAAARLRRLDEEAQIIMFEREQHISIANCGLPYYIGESIKDRSKLLVQTPEAMKQRFNLDIRTKSEVISVNTENKTVQVASQDRGVYEESYDALILSPGAKPVRPNLPGIESPLIFSLRNIPDTDKIKAKVQKEGTQSAVIIGGGFIGIEMAENLRELGLEVTLIERNAQILKAFDLEMAAVLAKELEQQGIKLLFSESVASFRETGDQIETLLESGRTVTSDLVMLAIGVTPDTSFLANSGVALGERGHILVNEKMETSAEQVFAVGDAVEVTDFVTGMKAAVPLAGPANKQGRIAADNVCGLQTTFKGTQGTSIIKVFGLTGAVTGSSERTLQRLNMSYHVSYVHPSSHASYYPGASPLTIKLLFDEQGIVLGAQAVGYDGVDKRIDDIATLIHFKGTVTDLTELELAYAPPYSSAKDPVNMAGYAAENILAGRTQVFVPSQLEQLSNEEIVLVDVRSEMEHQNGHISGSINIPVDELRRRLNELDPAKEIWVYCQVGLRGYTASRILAQKGFRVRNLTGGYKTYLMANYQPVSSDNEPAAGPGMQQTAAALETPVQPPAPALVPVTAPASMPLTATAAEVDADIEVDACGLSCPGPLIKVKQTMDQLQDRQIARISASDPGFYEDVQAWAGMSGNKLLKISKSNSGIIEAYIQKESEPSSDSAKAPAGGSGASVNKAADGTTMVVFSGDLDKAIASFIIANGAAASGKKVTLFFTFWGLNVLRRNEKADINKSFMGKMFGMMMPRGSRKLGLSRMNMMGMGSKMIRGVMHRSGIASLEQLMETAKEQGVELVACQMSMDVMGIRQEELIPGVKIGGVGYYLGKADQSGINLFI
ncbi:FAD-dependent oxidoreductase [Paenibacillus physcomitrellae]|uniref:Pyridine nucleotide-disulfide oxidoreductase n=1 Tax=Paenibacillus physcomitrellae TaxID=1619311 RepID=A0ABQ1FPB4_9BACL|nr:FAD-dependent oxidoreductase [Paenibacillus physcomitrellae]GGA22848.1 pyridine nucleotide-disulfide oxidoreductase [Paenibacillus physcomitrellae]